MLIKEIRKNIPLPKVSSSFVGKKKMVRKAGDLAYYNDGTVHFKDGILPMRVQLRDICTLFINSPNQLITSDDIYDQLDKALNKTTISKYVSELHTLLKTKYQRSVITNDKKNGCSRSCHIPVSKRALAPGPDSPTALSIIPLLK